MIFDKKTEIIKKEKNIVYIKTKRTINWLKVYTTGILFATFGLFLAFVKFAFFPNK